MALPFALDIEVTSYVESLITTFSNTIGSNNERVRWVVINHNLEVGATFSMSSLSTAAGVGTPGALGGRAGPPVRTTSVIGQHFRVVYPSPRTVNVCALVGHQLTTGAQVHFTSANTPTFAGEQIRAVLPVTSASTPVLHTYLSTPVVASAFGVYITDINNPDGFLEAYKWVNGIAEEWGHNPTFPFTEQTYAKTTTHETEGGVTWVYFHADKREVGLNLDLLYPEVKQQLQRGFSHLHYGSQPLLLHVNPTDPDDRMLYVRLMDRFGTSKDSGQLYSGSTLTFLEEALPRRD